MEALTLAPILYRARQTAFGFHQVRWTALQDHERERWRRIADRVAALPSISGRQLFEAWAVDLSPLPWVHQPNESRMKWQCMAWELDEVRRDQAA
jgi:hypothetical protein